MADLQIKNTLKIIIYIIVFIGTSGLLINKFPFIFDFFQNREANITNSSVPEPGAISYIEKIDNFAMQEFNENQQLIHYIEAKTYLNYKDSPIKLVYPIVTIYDDNGLTDYVLNSQSANYLDNGDFIFSGKVEIKPGSGTGHHMKTEELLVSSKTNNYSSTKKVYYYGDRAEVVAQDGMLMNAPDDKLDLIGYTDIELDDGQTLSTKNLVVDRSNGKEHYYSEFPTTYISDNNKVSSEAMDLDMQEDIINLYGEAVLENSDVTINTKNLVIDKSNGQEHYYSKFDTDYITNKNTVRSESIDLNMKTNINHLYGKVTILQSSGTRIDTSDLVIDKSDGREIYKTNNKIHYNSGYADIKAKGMYYDVSGQLMNLTGGVVASYE